MDYKVFYRKYRPVSFSGLVGQEYTVKMLKNAIINNKISHAYLFTGPRGTGKTSTAKIFAKTINCEHLENGEACGKCNSCLNFAHSSDIIEIDAASNNGVDDIRELINNVKIAPSESKYKIYIIDEVHMMTQSAFNALLLTLEEPPKHAIFIMATTNVENVPITILSRCQRFNFKKIDFDSIVSQIKYICDTENIKITEDALNEIAYLSEGGLRDAESLLDQLSSNNEEITVEKILANYGSISQLFIKKIVNCLEKNDISCLVEMLKELDETACDYKIFVKRLIKELVNVSVEIKTGVRNFALSYEKIKDIIFELNKCLNQISIHVNPYLLIETILLNYMDDVKTSSLETDNVIAKEVEVSNVIEASNDLTEVSTIVEETIQQVDEVETNNIDISIEDSNDTFEEDYNEYLYELKQVRVNNCFAGAKKDYLIKHQEVLNEILRNSSIKPDVKSLLNDASLVVSSKDIIVLDATLISTADLINHKLEEIEEEIGRFFEEKVKVIALSGEEWQELKQEYVKNLKNGVKYEMIDESSLEELKPVSNDSQLENFAAEMFGSDKIQVI